MEFKRKATDNEILKFQKNIVKVADKIEWWWVKVTLEDFQKNIHIYQNEKFGNPPRGWQFLTTDTCISHYAELLTKSDYVAPKQVLESNFQLIRSIAENPDPKKLFDPLWAYACYKKEGPFMIIDGVNRQIGAFIHQFLNKKGNVLPPSNAICGICLTKTKYTDIPNYFCN